MTENTIGQTVDLTTPKSSPTPNASQPKVGDKRAGCVCDCGTCPCNPKSKLKKPPQDDQKTKA